MTSPAPNPYKLTLPTVLTLSRVVMVPVFLVAFLRGDAVGYAVCYGVLALCEASDVLDGAAARKRNQTSSVGMLLDPLADTITRFCMFLGLLKTGLLPLWMAVVLFVRDISVAYLRSFAACEGIVISARWSGKVKAVIQAIALFVTCASFLLANQHAYLAERAAGTALILSALVGILSPLAVGLWLRLDTPSLAKLSVFMLAMLVPILFVYLLPAPAPSIAWLITPALWLATLVTVYSFFDYLLGFARGSRSRHADG